MARLTARIRDLERHRPRPDICPEHLRDPLGRARDYREGLAAFSPDPAERARYEAEEDAIDARPPCPRCGWKDEPAFRVVARPDWGQHGPA
jgi:hypothetical protein